MLNETYYVCNFVICKFNIYKRRKRKARTSILPFQPEASKPCKNTQERERERERERAPDFLITWNSKKKFREALILKPILSVTPMNLIAAVGGQGEK